MSEDTDKNLTELIFRLNKLYFLATLRNTFAIFFHIFNGIEFLHIFSTIHQQFIKLLGKLNVAEIETNGVKELPTIRGKND